jgi:hypothetical protein
MSLDSGKHSSGRNTPNQDLWPKWMWVAVPVLVVVVVAGLWWAIFSPGGRETPRTTPSPTVMLTRPQPTQRPTEVSTLAAVPITPTQQILTTLPTFTPTQQVVSTPSGAPTVAAAGLAVGSQIQVTGTGGTGLNMRAGAGTNQARVKTLSENTKLEIIGGPKEANGFTWWQVRDEAGTTGWVVDRYLKAQ